jgi:hypothetical protein
MRVIVAQLVEWRLAGETEVLGENLPQRHLVYHKSHMTDPRAAAVGSQRLTAWAMARPYITGLLYKKQTLSTLYRTKTVKQVDTQYA